MAIKHRNNSSPAHAGTRGHQPSHLPRGAGHRDQTKRIMRFLRSKTFPFFLFVSLSTFLYRCGRHSRESSLKKLELEDLILGDYIGCGAVNVVCHVKFPDWWYVEQNIPSTAKYVLKMTVQTKIGAAEIDALRALNEDGEKARRHKVTPMVFSATNVTNPFHPINKAPMKTPSSFPRGIVMYLQQKERIFAHVVPFLKEADFQNVTALESLQDVRSYFHSLLSQLAYAHSLGVNNLDLQPRNTWVDSTDKTATIFDWNGHTPLGNTFYEEDRNHDIAPPEGVIEHAPDGRTLQMTSISGYDVWSAGIMFANLIYYPCKWMKFRRRLKDYFRNLILAVGGNTSIPVSTTSTDYFDLAKIAGLDLSTIQSVEFHPPIVDGNDHECSANTQFLDEEKKQGRSGEAVDLLRNMMMLSPLVRPTCDELVKHPFFQ